MFEVWFLDRIKMINVVSEHDQIPARSRDDIMKLCQNVETKFDTLGQNFRLIDALFKKLSKKLFGGGRIQ